MVNGDVEMLLDIMEVSQLIFIFKWIVCYALIMFAMCVDNICWIPADRKWYVTNELRPHFYVMFIIKTREYIFPRDKFAWKFLFTDRIKSVLTHQYDILPAILTSFILALITN